LAAKKLGLNYIGIDVNPEYVNISNQRLGEISKKDIIIANKKIKRDNSFNLFDYSEALISNIIETEEKIALA
jgi:DNA modification methylase